MKIKCLILIAILGCSNGPSKQEYDKLSKELEECKKNVAELQNSPQKRLAEAFQFLAIKDFTAAKSHFEELIQKFPGLPESKQAETELRKVDIIIKRQKEDEERKKALGFKALKETYYVKYDYLTLEFNNIRATQSWTFDSYGETYHSRDAERGNIFVAASVRITSESKEPKLPRILVYKLSNGVLNYMGTMGYEFVSWKDYATYLGNYADYGNDFAHVQTIAFSTGTEVQESDVDKQAVFVIMKKELCFERKDERFHSPPVSYEANNCAPPSSLFLNDFDQDYVLIKILNKSKL